MTSETVDVLIVGAGLSGIAAAYYLRKLCPDTTWTIVEGRDNIGGTWDFFRFPGIRSDSDMYTLGYRFRPWPGDNAIADGPSILQYIKDTAHEFGINKEIRFRHRVRRISWSSQDAIWTVDIERRGGEETIQLRCNFLFMCTGYYRYDKGYTPQWHGIEDFGGTIIHPQNWSDDLDYADKRVIVIGSGATAVTIVPALAQRAAHVTMLQRSPSYIFSLPTQDPQVNWMRAQFPDGLASWLARWKMILRGIYYYRLARKQPEETRDLIMQGIREVLGTENDAERHFDPVYNPWDQRVCVAADADLFTAIKDGRVSMATAQIERFTEEGVQLDSGEVLPADIVVTATGMVMRIMDGVEIIIDGQAIDIGSTLSYKGIMYSNIPNLASAFGYINASWTLKCELICEYVCRLLKYMDRRGYQQCAPRLADDSAVTEPMINFTSSYVQRAMGTLPRQGSKRPWKVYQNYLQDLLMMRFGALDDGVMEFKRLGR